MFSARHGRYGLPSRYGYGGGPGLISRRAVAGGDSESAGGAVGKSADSLARLGLGSVQSLSPSALGRVAGILFPRCSEAHGAAGASNSASTHWVAVKV